MAIATHRIDTALFVTIEIPTILIKESTREKRQVGLLNIMHDSVFDNFHRFMDYSGYFIVPRCLVFGHGLFDVSGNPSRFHIQAPS